MSGNAVMRLAFTRFGAGGDVTMDKITSTIKQWLAKLTGGGKKK